jgi:Tfp pilus assembly protein FimT
MRIFRGRIYDTGNEGFTLIELMMVITIIMIMTIAMGFSFVTWKTNYQVESDIKLIYGALSLARIQAMQRKNIFFVNVPNVAPNNMFLIYEDTSPSPDGDGILDVSNDTLIEDLQDARGRVVEFGIIPTSGERHMWFGRDGILYNSSGVIVVEPMVIRINLEEVDSDLEAASEDPTDTEKKVLVDYNTTSCLNLESTRTNLGMWTGTVCEDR